MNMKKIGLSLFALVATIYASAQYPQVSAEDKKKSDSLMAAAVRHSDSAWAVAYPIIQQQAKEGRPYIPWASRYDELPHADIPAFPGAEGGGKISFGGRGGKVFVSGRRGRSNR